MCKFHIWYLQIRHPCPPKRSGGGWHLFNLASMKIQFKTTINCGNCVRTVTGFLNEVKGMEKWNVDITNPDKILTVEGENVSVNEVVAAVEEAGFEIEVI